MLRNWIVTALRNLLKHRLYSLINILGLAVGLAAAIVILLFVRNETSYDGFISDADRIFQVGTEASIPGRPTTRIASSTFHLGPAYKEDHPDAVELSVRLLQQRPVIQVGDVKHYDTVQVADAGFFQMFDFPFVVGDPATALADPGAIVLTESAARKYFGATDVLGRTLTLEHRHDVRVTGVLRDLPSNTHLDLFAIVPLNSVLMPPDAFSGPENWGNICCLTYVKFAAGTDIDRRIAEAPDWVKRRAPALQTPQGPIAIGEIMVPIFRPLTAIHTDPVEGDAVPGVSLTEILTLAAVAVLILVIACINFMNLATARATQRAREVSVRKVVGASRGQIVVQFVGESVLITLVGLVLAVALVELALPGFSGFVGKDLALDYGDAGLMAMLLGLALVVGIGGGAYPAFVLSGFIPAKVLKGNSASATGGGAGRLRVALVVVQFAISIALMVATGVVYGQFLYSQTKNLGFDKENVVVVGYWTTPGVQEHKDAFLETLRNHPSVLSIGMGSFVPGDPWESNTLIRRPGDPARQELVFRNDSVGFDYFDTLGMRIVAGRNFEEARGTDMLVLEEWMLTGQPPPDGAQEVLHPATTIVNRTATQRLGFATPEEAVGQEILVLQSQFVTLRSTIVGVVEDFHFRSLHEPISPAVYFVDPRNLHAMAIRIRAGQVPDALALIDRTWASMIQDRPMDRSFLDVALQRQYERERRTATAFAAFSGLAIVIACLGLFGLAAFTAERRTKEIGLRKVLGASVLDIVRLMVWQFSKPVLIANVIAWPIAWFGMSRWLEGFAYRIDLNALPFLAAGVAALAIAWGTVGVHAMRVARAKPVTALRYE